MSNEVEIDKPGIYRAYPMTWTAEDSSTKTPKQGEEPSRSVAIAIQFGIFQQWYPDDAGGGVWSDEWPIGYFARGRKYVIGKEGAPLPAAIDELAKAKLWDGDWDALGGLPPREFVLIDVRDSEYQGKKQLRVEWINPNADVPVARGGGFTPADSTLLASLRSRFPTVRALAGGKPAGAAPAPPPPAGARTSPQPAIQPTPAVAPSHASPPSSHQATLPTHQTAPPSHQNAPPSHAAPPPAHRAPPPQVPPRGNTAPPSIPSRAAPPAVPGSGPGSGPESLGDEAPASNPRVDFDPNKAPF